jgi:hypothetical protein
MVSVCHSAEQEERRPCWTKGEKVKRERVKWWRCEKNVAKRIGSGSRVKTERGRIRKGKLEGF